MFKVAALYKFSEIDNPLEIQISLKKTLKEFLHMPKELSNNQTSTKEFIQLIHQNIDTEINWFFDQYLYKSKLPTLIIEEEIKGNKKFVDFRWKEEGFKMPLEIRFYSFDGERNRKIPITNLSYKIAIPKESKLVIDPNNWLLFEKEQVNSPEYSFKGMDGSKHEMWVVDDENKVTFYPTKTIKDTIDGMWVSGLPETVNLIVSGQEYISIGETIN